MISKEKILEQLHTMPDSFELDDFIESLFLLKKIEKSRLESQNNQVYSNEEMKDRMKSWSI